ncbi:hypothetical protein B0I72DRAFT_137954 [Yarrowia lipolytica]|uniref:Uncharacterized protein n=1 Tax=Yarrowia lipolytica TaxID=4952 RepID=A0A371BZ65_YARLL|nr:hypothetical protein B0I71DRAFT_136018 [Yarrowia lipolytica]RDW32537.1 hypothetical protein B0I72DRAFT_137954 [Yarrowia lipolytica]RDW39300.1 hypothetical protein B0I73DRAFT_132294 [Yarrowia lipolytica]RDW45267.1 hypothetical protein B0I74DRAFT_139116 [Yarrowia lipolytica]RDW51181.1 hypothetical protein B0I75DRAFT_140302 [Yarrowia lipolytica]
MIHLRLDVLNRHGQGRRYFLESRGNGTGSDEPGVRTHISTFSFCLGCGIHIHSGRCVFFSNVIIFVGLTINFGPLNISVILLIAFTLHLPDVVFRRRFAPALERLFLFVDQIVEIEPFGFGLGVLEFRELGRVVAEVRGVEQTCFSAVGRGQRHVVCGDNARDRGNTRVGVLGMRHGALVARRLCVCSCRWGCGRSRGRGCGCSCRWRRRRTGLLVSWCVCVSVCACVVVLCHVILQLLGFVLIVLLQVQHGLGVELG